MSDKLTRRAKILDAIGCIAIVVEVTAFLIFFPNWT